MASTDKHMRVPIKMGEFSVMDSEFDNVRERFDSEMKKMEDEMNKFRSELLSKESNFFKNKSSSSSRAFSSRSESRKIVDGKEVREQKSFSSSSSSSSTGGDLMASGGLGSHSNWLQGLNSPLIQESNESSGQKELKLRFDVSQYAPEEIMVKTVDNKLLVHAKHEEKGEGKQVFREYNREFLLPNGTDPEQIKSSLSRDGILTVEAPLPQAAITSETK